MCPWGHGTSPPGASRPGPWPGSCRCATPCRSSWTCPPFGRPRVKFMPSPLRQAHVLGTPGRPYPRPRDIDPPGVHEPEGNVNAPDFFDSVTAGKTLGKQHLALVMLSQCTLGRLAIQFERNHKLGTEVSREMPSRNHGFFHSRATREWPWYRRRQARPHKTNTHRHHRGLRFQLRPRLRRIPSIAYNRLRFLFRTFLLGLIANFDIRQRKFQIAVIADEWNLRAVVTQGTSACRTLAVDAFCIHSRLPSLIIELTCCLDFRKARVKREGPCGPYECMPWDIGSKTLFGIVFYVFLCKLLSPMTRSSNVDF